MEVEKFLDENGVEYVLHEHAPLFTCADVEKLDYKIPGLDCKNLVLRNKNKSNFYLVVLPSAKRADLKLLKGIFNESKISFAGEDILMETLGVKPGSVSPFGLINDKEKRLKVFIDRDVLESEVVNFHPNRNTASLEVTQKMFQRFLDLLEHDINVLDL